MRWNVRVNRVVFNAFNAFEAADRKTKELARDSRAHVNVV